MIPSHLDRDYLQKSIARIEAIREDERIWTHQVLLKTYREDLRRLTSKRYGAQAEVVPKGIKRPAGLQRLQRPA
jgi:hypothetical protein